MVRHNRSIGNGTRTSYLSSWELLEKDFTAHLSWKLQHFDVLLDLLESREVDA